MLAKHIKARSDQMLAESKEIREAYSTHNSSAGSKREGLAIKFLRTYLPRKFHVTSGFAIDSDGIMSKQSDILIVDDMSNVAFFPSSNNEHEQWPVESVYAVIEVKTMLDNKALSDAIEKCVAFKSMKRVFLSKDNLGLEQRIKDSLFCIFAFDSPNLKTTIINLIEQTQGVDPEHHPDLIVVLNKVVLQGGSYYDIIKNGQMGSEHRKQVEERGTPKAQGNFGYRPTHHSLLSWFTWLNSWLAYAGSRTADQTKYIHVPFPD